MQVIRFFQDEVTGAKLAMAWDGKQEVVITQDQAWDIEAKSQAAHDAYMLRWERGE